jgi:hypothetical protein
LKNAGEPLYPLPRKKIETIGWRPSGQLLVSIRCISPKSSATVVAVQARGREPLRHKPETAPSPGTHPLGRAYTFAGLGTSVSCLATYSLGTLFHIIGKKLNIFCHILTKKQYRCGKRPLDKLGPAYRRAAQP